MIKNYLRVAWRTLRRNRGHSFINISGLAIGMAVAMLIGLWIWDELTFDRYDPHFKRVAQIMQTQTFNGAMRTQRSIPVPLGTELHKSFGNDLKSIVMTSGTWQHIVSVGDKMLNQAGAFMEPDAPRVLGLRIVAGTEDALRDPSSMLLSQSVATALFGTDDPLHKIVRLDNKDNFTVAGVYADLPNNSTFHLKEIVFIAPWDFYVHHLLAKDVLSDWGNNSFQCFVELADNANMEAVSRKIRNVKMSHVGPEDAVYKPVLFLHPMSKWHLYSQFRNGVIDGGRIQYVWLFGTIGFFVLLLACINFMNLSTARSEKRAKEVGIRKTIGSMRGQLIGQFYTESMLIALIAFVLALGIALLLLPFFNDIAAKTIEIPWQQPFFWVGGLLFSVFTGIVAGSYPALYLSSFRPIKVLKGTFKAGRFAAVPRQVLVVLQFSVSVILIIGTIVVFRQIQYAKDRPIGYSREGLVVAELSTDDLHKHFEAVRDDLLRSGLVTEVAESTSPATQVNNNTSEVTWQAKDPSMTVDFANVGVSVSYGKTIGWQFAEGRDFSAQLLTDSSAIVLNEAAVKYMGLQHPVGMTVRVWDKDRLVIGVIKDMVMESPWEPVKQTIYYLNTSAQDYFNYRISPTASAHDAIEVIGKVWKTYSPAAPFNYQFVDKSYAIKFADEERVGRLAGVFAVLAIFISALGLFGMASFMAEQRVKEIGVRKVLGASVFNVWRLLSRDFLILVGLALVIALPAGWYFMDGWLRHYPYRTEMAWWIFAVAGAGAIVITIITVSYQAVKAGLMNPVTALRSE
jgi:putative ABC transport system permease protein